MARLPFFESTWHRKAKLTGVVLGVYLAARLIAYLSQRLIDLGWGDIPVSLLVLIYLAFFYVEIWVILERHTRPAISILAAALLAGFCIASPFIAFDPVATGSIPDRLRFWEPMAGMDRPPGQRIAVVAASYLREPVQEAHEALQRAEGELLSSLALVKGSERIEPAEAAQLRLAVQQAARASGLNPARSALLAEAVLVRLARQRMLVTGELLRARASCVADALQQANDGDDGAQGLALPVAECGKNRELLLKVDLTDLAPLQEQSAVASFLEKALELADSWVQTTVGGSAKPPAKDGPDFRLHPLEQAAGFSALLASIMDGTIDSSQAERLRELPAWLERYQSAVERFWALEQDTVLLETQIALIPEQLQQGLAVRRIGAEQQSEWVLADPTPISSVIARRSMAELTRWLDSRPRAVLAHANAIQDVERQEQFLRYVSQMHHWHLRDPEKIKARLEQADDEFRPSDRLGALEFPPIALCQEMEQAGMDAVILQLASLDRGGEKHLRLQLVNRDPCLTVWDHDVPIYDQADVLAATVDDGKALSEAVSAFFSRSLLGTDYLGKDLAMQLIKGTEGFFLPGLLAVAIGLGLGVLLGAFAGYMGGVVDQGITFVTTLIGSFPRLVFILLACTIPETPSMFMIAGITGALFIPQVSEAVRRRVLALKAEDFIVASRAHGLSLPRILFFHMVWLQCFPEIVRQALYLFVYMIFLETALSYLEGPGAPPEIPSWGRMLANATSAMFRGQYWHALVPTAAIVFTTLGVTSLGDVIVGQAKEERL